MPTQPRPSHEARPWLKLSSAIQHAPGTPQHHPPNPLPVDVRTMGPGDAEQKAPNKT